MPEMDKNNLWFLALRFRPWKVARDNSPIYMNSISGYPVSGLAHHQQYGIPNPIGSPFPSPTPAVTGLKFPCLSLQCFFPSACRHEKIIMLGDALFTVVGPTSTVPMTTVHTSYIWA